MKKDDILFYLNELYYEANSEEELDFIVDFVNGVLNDIKYLDNIDIDGISPAHWPFELETNFLRDDEVDHLLTNEKALQNATSTQDGYVKYLKVV